MMKILIYDYNSCYGARYSKHEDGGRGKVTVKIGVEKWSNLVSSNKDKK